MKLSANLYFVMKKRDAFESHVGFGGDPVANLAGCWNKNQVYKDVSNLFLLYPEGRYLIIRHHIDTLRHVY